MTTERWTFQPVRVTLDLGEMGCDGALDLIFTIDSSGSINDLDPRNWDRAKHFIKVRPRLY